MAIVWDALLTRSFAAALEGRLATGTNRMPRLRAIRFDYEASTVDLWFREATVTAHLHPQAGHIVVTDPDNPPEDARLLAADVRRITSLVDDRIIEFQLVRPRGKREPMRFVLELMTNQWNAIVTAGRDDRIRHVLHPRSAGDRELKVGAAYNFPTPSTRAGRTTTISEDEWSDASRSNPDSVRASLLSRVAWTSPINIDVLLGSDGYVRWRSLIAPTEVPGTGPHGAVILHLDGRNQPYPCPLPGIKHTPSNDLITAFNSIREGTAGEPAIPKGWTEALKRKAKRAQARCSALERQLRDAADPAATRGFGDLLLARYHEIPHAARSIDLEGFDGVSVSVQLDPALSVKENAELFYERARKAERAAEQIPRMLEQARGEADRLKDLLRQLEDGSIEKDVLRAELPESQPAHSQHAMGAPLPYRTFRSSGGIEIRVGRGSKHNDALTFRHARPNDIWLHAEHVPGAHVVLRWSRDENPPAKDLDEAATLAAVHSRAHTSGSVPVIWTRRKYVRKPRGAKPGSVIPDRVRTVFVEPDREIVDRLGDG